MLQCIVREHNSRPNLRVGLAMPRSKKFFNRNRQAFDANQTAKLPIFPNDGLLLSKDVPLLGILTVLGDTYFSREQKTCRCWGYSYAPRCLHISMSSLPPSPSAASAASHESSSSTLDCPICLCPLVLSSTTAIGVCAPCGHPFHPECYGRWAAQSATAESDRSRGRERRAKCPSCSQHVDAFAGNVFLGAAVRGGGGGLDDGAVSSSSSSSEDDSEDEEQEWNEEDTNSNHTHSNNTSGNGVAAAANADGDACADDDEPEVICLNDETAGISTQIQALSPPKKRKRKRDKSAARSRTSSDDNADDDDAMRKYRSKARRYKRRVRALEAQTTERNRHHVKITSRLQQIEERERQLQRERDDIQSSMDQHEDKMTALELDLSRAQRHIRALQEEVTSTKRENGQLRQDRTAVDGQMRQIRQRHQKEMEAAQAVGMSEVEELQRERPKMVEEMRRLKEALNKANRKLNAARNDGGSADPSSSSASATARGGKQLNAAAAAVRMAREMRNAQDAREEAERREAKRQKDREQKKQMARKISSQAARMSRAARGGTAKVAPARQNSANAALGGGLSARDKNRQKERGMQSFQLSSAASSRQRMDASSSVGFFDGGIPSPECSRSISGNSSMSRASSNSFGGTNSNVNPGSGLILLGNTSSLRRSSGSNGGNYAADTTSSAVALASLARPALPAIAGRKKNDIRAMFAKKR